MFKKIAFASAAICGLFMAHPQAARADQSATFKFALQAVHLGQAVRCNPCGCQHCDVTVTAKDNGTIWVQVSGISINPTPYTDETKDLKAIADRVGAALQSPEGVSIN